jgi:imidazolonepropionase-like amidohydrolase
MRYGTRAALVLGLLWSGVGLAAGETSSSLEEIEARGRKPLEVLPEAAAPAVLLRGGTVLTAAGDRLEDGWVLMRDGRIADLGSGEPPVFEGVAVVDVTDHYVTPGLIDAHSHLGLFSSPSSVAHGDGNEATDPVTAGVWGEHSMWPQDPGLARALAGGVTTFQTLPGSTNLVGGRGVVVHMVPTRGARAMRFPGAPETVKMACGENPKRTYGDRGGPSTRMGNLEGHRSAFLEARAFLEEWEAYEEEHAEWAAEKAAHEAALTKKEKRDHPDPGDEPEPPDRDLGKETLAGILRGEVLPQVHCYQADDMLSMLQLADEMGFRIRAFHHALESYKIRDILAEHEVASCTWADWWGFKLEAFDGIPQSAALLTEAGARVTIKSDSSIGIQRLNQEAAKALRSGREGGLDVSEDDALRWVTLHPAWVLGIDDQVGSIEPGKRADVVVWDAHPFSVYARARWVFVDGALRWDAERPQVWSDFRTGWEVTP